MERCADKYEVKACSSGNIKNWQNRVQMRSVPGDILHIGKRIIYASNNIVPKYIKPKLRLLNLQL